MLWIGTSLASFSDSGQLRENEYVMIPQRLRNRGLSKPCIRLRCANDISTFLRSLREIAYCWVCDKTRAVSREAS